MAPAVTGAFGAYAPALLASLLVLGSVSDHLGRRPVIGLALLVRFVAMVVFVTASGFDSLLVGRILSPPAPGWARSDRRCWCSSHRCRPS